MIRRNIQDAVRRALSDTPMLLLNGGRQMGKPRWLTGELREQLSCADPRTTLELCAPKWQERIKRH